MVCMVPVEGMPVELFGYRYVAVLISSRTNLQVLVLVLEPYVLVLEP